MGREVPKRVDVLPDLAEVQALGVDVTDVAELAGVDVVLDLPDRRVEQEDVPDHERRRSSGRQLDQVLTLGARHRQRLLDEDVLSGQEGPSGERVMGDDRGGDDDSVDVVVGEHVVEVGHERAIRVLPRNRSSLAGSASHTVWSRAPSTSASALARFGPQ